MGVSVGVLISPWVKVGVFKTVGEAVFIGVKVSPGERNQLPCRTIKSDYTQKGSFEGIRILS